MTAREMFEKLGYTRNLDSKKLIYAKELKGMFRYLEITFDLTEKEVELYDDHEAYTINNALLKAIQQQLKELGWLEEETCTNLSDYNSTDLFKCSNCGIELGEYRQFEIDEDYGDRYGHQYKPKYCPNCGSKIVD
jgi:DNA-directed RNA polymerase subunit RPC12/RpoP|nr:MAG TPA: Thaumarchaeal output domain 1 [Caudoviricetes sp.]